tara:strand:+ start:1002 stop:1415 length:414 start_codon:yes stop_codon:yes gene_type:complete
MAKISKDQAKEEVNKWLNSKGYDEDEREGYEAVIEGLEAQFVKGKLRLEDNGDIIQTLKFPICEVESGDIIHAEIAYKPRVKVKELNRRQDQLKVKDADSKTRVGIYASSNVKDAFMDRMDPMDYRVATYIGIFLVV